MTAPGLLLTQKQAALALGIGLSTFKRLCAVDPDLARCRRRVLARLRWHRPSLEAYAARLPHGEATVRA